MRYTHIRIYSLFQILIQFLFKYKVVCRQDFFSSIIRLESKRKEN